MDVIKGESAQVRARVALIAPGQQPHGNRRVRRAKGRQAGLRNRNTLLFRQPAQCRHIAGLALIGRHPERGIALEMLDRAVAFGPGQIDIAKRNIVLKVDKGFARIFGSKHGPDRSAAGRRANRFDVLSGCSRQECLAGLIPIQRCPARLHMQMDHWCEAAGHGQQIGLPAHDLAVDSGVDFAQMMPCTLRGERQGFIVHRKAAGCSRRSRPAIQHRHHFSPGSAQCSRGQISIVVIGGNHHAASRHHAEAAEIGSDRLAEHHPGAIIVRKSQRPFERAGGQHHPFGPNMPQPLRDPIGRRRARFGQMLVQGDQVIIPIAPCRGPQQNPPTKRSDPCRRSLSPDRIEVLGIADQRRRENPVLLDQHDPLARFGRRQCCGQPGGPGPDHQHITKGCALGIAIGIDRDRRIAQSGSAADEPFVKHPALGRTEEGLVVKSGR